MDTKEYRIHGKEMVDYIADYLENIRDRDVFPSVKPGYLSKLIPDSAPLDGEPWPKIFADIERVIMPGMVHWQSPRMHAYFPALNSYPSLLGDMLADGINCLGFTWVSSPACTELEAMVMNWLGKGIGLPDDFLHKPNSLSGGIIMTTMSECTLTCLLAARNRAIDKHKQLNKDVDVYNIYSRLVAYCSDQAHSSIEKAGLISFVKMRFVPSEELSMRGEKLRETMDEDIKNGLIPFWVCATLGTTGACSFDCLSEIGPVCKEYNVWLHVDAAYAGSAFICPEYRHWLKGIEHADSFGFNPSKWLMVHFDCTAMWVKDSGALHETFVVDPFYLKHDKTGVIDYMHWQIPLSRRFRALKLWFVMRNFGIMGLQKHIRENVRLAQKFEALLSADKRFEITAPRHLGMVVFCLVGDSRLTERLLKRMNARGHVHCIPACISGRYVIRFTVTSTNTTNEDIIRDWKEIQFIATEVLEEANKLTCLGRRQMENGDREKVMLKDIRARNENFGSSLLLANSPMSPKVVNGSFAAIYDHEDIVEEMGQIFRKCLSSSVIQDSPAMRRRIRGILMTGKQYSLDSRMDLVYGIISNVTARPTSAPSPSGVLPLTIEDVDESPSQSNEETIIIHN
ncbi:histidine decarboxylase isoform X2 [Chrysoperla carnea]|uniref:histidine decarboxylase isoform X2 n=1 Tax=Chrysoperla carnea TaxID=189513 RepID=UPI001D0925CD|nr:histidine decarboxylase isoform X2 [Chrysoperla carnea]